MSKTKHQSIYRFDLTLNGIAGATKPIEINLAQTDGLNKLLKEQRLTGEGGDHNFRPPVHI